VKSWIAIGLVVIGTGVVGAQTNTPPRRPPTIAELERAYLDGRITAKEFQQYLKQAQQQPPVTAPPPQSSPQSSLPATQPAVQPHPPGSTQGASTNVDVNARALEMLRKLTGKTNEPVSVVRGPSVNPQASRPPQAVGNPAPPTTQPPPSTVQPAPPAEVANPAITDAESKLNELLKAKEAREKAAQSATNAPASNGPKSKRQRLDDLLKQFIDGKMSEAEYKQRREKIVGEPD
jgi:hypothetical protein